MSTTFMHNAIQVLDSDLTFQMSFLTCKWCSLTIYSYSQSSMKDFTCNELDMLGMGLLTCSHQWSKAKGIWFHVPKASFDEEKNLV